MKDPAFLSRRPSYAHGAAARSHVPPQQSKRGIASSLAKLPLCSAAARCSHGPKVSKTLNPFSDANNKNQVNSLVFQTIYERGNASDLETLVSLAGDAGLSPAEVRAYLRSREGVGDVLRNDRRAKTELNVRGVPLFVVRAAAGPEAAESSSASGAADVGASVGGKGRSTEIVLKGAVGADELLRAFAAVSRGT